MRSLVVDFLAFVSYWCGIDEVFYHVNRRVKRIVTFHNVLPGNLWMPGLANGVSNSLDEFDLIVTECSRRFGFSTDLFDASTLTFTFDDGYHNQYEYAFKYLVSRNIPAYVFVSGAIQLQSDGEVQEGCLVIDKLLHWVSCVPIEYVPGGDRMRFWTSEVWPFYKKDVSCRGRMVLKWLDGIYPYSEVIASLPEAYKRERLGGISEQEKKEMRLAGWEIGWHTHDHYPLGQLSESDLEHELNSPSECRGVCLSYPFGTPDEVGIMASEMAYRLGYPCAVSNCMEGSAGVRPGYFLPRMTLPPNRYRLHFRLSGAEFFLRNRRLLG